MKSIALSPWVIAVLGVLTLSGFGCKDLGSETPGALTEVLEDYSYITDPEARWRAYGLKNYVLEEVLGCFCAHGGEYCRVYVRDNQVTDVVVISTGEHVNPQIWSAYKTADGLFAFVRSIKRDSVASFQMSHDPRFGFPNSVYVDYSGMIADEEMAYGVRKVWRMTE